MLVGRCSSELSSHRLRGKLKKSQPPSEAVDLQFRGPLLETPNTVLKQNCHLACPGPPWDRSVALWRDCPWGAPARLVAAWLMN